MADWHPVENLLPTSWLFPVPGTKSPFAEIRYLPVSVEGRQLWRFRAVRINVEPRCLVGVGYFESLEDAAMACQHAAIHASVRPELNETRR